MKLAWFRRERPPAARPLDDSAALIEELRRRHDITVFSPATAEGASSAHGGTPFDLIVYEMEATAERARPTSLFSRQPGVLMARSLVCRDLGEAVTASRLTVVPHAAVAEDLRAQHPEADIRVAATGVHMVQPVVAPGVNTGPLVVGSLSPDRTDLLTRVLEGAGLATSGSATLLVDVPERVLRDADVIVSVPWPWFGEAPTEALAAMAAGKPVVVLETAGTAEWPALDPQSWQPRGAASGAPIVISVDPLDEEHSLVLALRRLASDRTLRTQLGAAGHAWWQTRATPAHAAIDWDGILRDAAAPRPTVSSPAENQSHMLARMDERQKKESAN